MRITLRLRKQSRLLSNITLKRLIQSYFNLFYLFYLDFYFLYVQIALQFPDELLPYSQAVYEKISSRVRAISESSIDLYILADTTFGSTDIDEISAQHGNADFLVHYGQANLNL